MNIPTNCGNGQADTGEECDPPGKDCPTGKTCTSTCSCANNPIGWMPKGFPWPPKKGVCGDNNVDTPNQAGWNEICDPPGGACTLPDGTQGTCSKDCTGCSGGICGDGSIDPPWEDCDPPGTPSCPPMAMPDGGCSLPLCDANCGCPEGEPCEGVQLQNCEGDPVKGGPFSEGDCEGGPIEEASIIAITDCSETEVAFQQPFVGNAFRTPYTTGASVTDNVIQAVNSRTTQWVLTIGASLAIIIITLLNFVTDRRR